MEYFFVTAFKILVLLNPFAVLTTFLALTAGYTQHERSVVVWWSACAAFGAGVVLFFSGNLLFSALGINVDLFKAGGGVILMICAVMLVWGRESEVRPAAGHGCGIAVVPIAIPMAVGPGTSAGLIVIGLERTGTAQTCAAIGALFLAVV